MIERWQRGIALPRIQDRTLRIGVLEDSPTTQSVVRAWLEGRGQFHIAEQAHSLEEATHWVEDDDLDAVIVDWHLPDGDGWGLAKALKDLRPDLRVFIYTGDKRPLFQPPGLHWLDLVELQDWPELIARVCRGTE